MSPSPLRPATAPYSNKQPTECPYCGSHVLTRKGLRKKKLEIVQLWRCASCKRVFTPGPAALHNKTYPIRIVLEAMTLYSLGYSLPETAKRLKSKTGRTISPNTIATWIGAHKEHLSFRRLRAEAKTIYPPAQTVRSIKLYHRQVYAFAYHRSKLALLYRSPQHRRFARIATFLESVPTTCPHDLFRSDDPQARASQARPNFADLSKVIVNRKENTATHIAALIIPTIGNNKLRHATLQKFMLTNDSTTLAVEIPIWLTEPEITTLETKYHIDLVPDQIRPRSITGHIDFLQVRNDAVHILDYKPDARTNKPIAQLAIYALALTVRISGLNLLDIKCAWFNEEEYNEFYPRTLFARSPRK